jgi:hypothetical protein
MVVGRQLYGVVYQIIFTSRTGRVLLLSYCSAASTRLTHLGDGFLPSVYLRGYECITNCKDDPCVGSLICTVLTRAVPLHHGRKEESMMCI